MKKIVTLIAAIALVSFGFAQKKPTSGPLDKKSYIIELVQDGKKKAEPIKDELKFAAAKMSAKMITEEGFKANIYDASPDSSATPITVSFSCEAKGESADNTFKWEGTITEDAIEGTAAIYKKGKVKKSYTFSGTLKGKKTK